MKQRLLLFDLLLLALVVLTAMLLKQRWEQANAREMALLQQRIRPIPAPALAPLVPVAPVQGSLYLEVAEKMLFSRDRNSNIIVEPPPPPPPSPPVPALPWAHGVIQFGEKPTVILSEVPGGAEKSYQQGDEIGPFKVLDVNTTHILFEWNGLRILRTIEEITDHTAPREKGTAVAQAAAPTALEQTKTAKPKEGPTDIDMGNNAKACSPSDTSPAGTIVDGMRKVVATTPFGPSCRWVAAQ